MELPTLHQKIWDKALPRQDLRDDKGHAFIVTLSAITLGKKLNAELDVIIPAAILHDTGYYGFSKQILTDLMSKKLTKEKEAEIKDLHMIRGEEFAKKVLKELNYDEKKTATIAKIIRNHDKEDDNPTLIEEKIVRDADKLWRYSKAGFELDMKRLGKSKGEWKEKLAKNFDKPNYFYTQEAKEIAQSELEKR